MRRLTTFIAALFIGLGGATAVADDAAPAAGAAVRETVLVAGATGRTGREVVRQLREAGYRVKALVRDPAAAGGILGAADDGLEYFTGDVRERASTDAAVAGSDYVISALGSTRKEPGDGPEFVDYGGIRNLAQSAAGANVKQIVIVSSAGVTQEDHPLNAMFDNVLVWKGKGEQAVRDSGVPYTIVRPGGLVDRLGGENGVELQQGDRGTGIIPRADVAAVCVAALKEPAAHNRTFEVYGTKGPPSTDWAALFGALKPDPE